jgi:hypothetical protein
MIFMNFRIRENKLKSYVTSRTDWIREWLVLL